MSAPAETHLYEVLGVSHSADKSELKKAYRKLILTSHPDKVPEDEREGAETRFKEIQEAYEILNDDDNRAAYDQYGMAAFEKGGGPGAAGGPDLEEMLAQMFGGGMPGGMGGMGGMPGMGGMGGGPGARRRGKGQPEVQQYEVTLEELYKGKTTRFASTKNIICEHCKGSGGKERAKAKTCDTCKGQGRQTKMRMVGPGLATQETVACSTCNGKGSFYHDKDKCKKCKGVRTTKQKKVLELYVPRGAIEGEKIVLAGEADQDPDDTEPGDIVFVLEEKSHGTFARAGADLQAELEISLAEALTGFNRTVLTHLDGRGISLNLEQSEGKVLRPDEVLKVPGEGMPIKRSDSRGDLYLVVKIKFPEDGWLKKPEAVQRVRDVLPKAEPVESKHNVEDVEEVDFESVENLDGFGAGSDDPRAGAEWEDDDEDEDGAQAQCAQQ